MLLVRKNITNDKENAYYWAERDPSHFLTDSTKWGYYPIDRIFLTVKPWEPIRFRYYYLSHPDEGFYASPYNSPRYDLFTDYPNSYGIGNGRMIFESFGDSLGQVFPMHWISRDSGAIGSPIIYSDPQPEFYLPDSGMYRVIIGNVLPNVNGTLSVIDTMSHVLVTDIRSHQGDTVLIGPYAEGMILKFELSGMKQCGGQSDYMSGGIGFESWNDYDFQDAAIWVEYAAKPVDHLELWSTSETIYYGDTLDVDIVPCGSDSLFSPLGYDYKFEFSVELTEETSRFVELIYEDQGSNIVEHIPSNNRRGMGVRLAANKEEPDSVVNLTFRLKAFYIGGGGAASSITTVPDGQTEIKVQTKISLLNQSKQTLSKKDGKITLSFGTQKREINRTAAKKLQAMSKQPKKRKIGRILVNDKSKNILPLSYSKKEIKASIMDGETDNAIVVTEWVMGINPPQEILLGETIYFQAVEDPINSPEHKKKLLIIPLKKIGDKHEPRLSGVHFTVEKLHGDNLGVYYDEKLDENGSSSLKPDIIRLVGRYWKGDANKYTVRLTATTSDRNGHMLIEVKKPDVLGDPNLTDEVRKTKVKDVLGEDLWLDEWIIKYAGENGIFPQIIKAQIQCESNFKPAYRWEPFVDSYEQKRGYFKQSRYKITLDPQYEGDPPIPWQDHINAKPIYPHGEYTTIWDRFYNNSTWSNTSASSGTYNGRRINGDFIWYRDAVIGWESAFLEAISEITNSVDDARAVANKWIKNKYQMDVPAQTRIAASYGFLQILYATACDRGYDEDTKDGTCNNHLPEYLNLTQLNFDCAIPFLASKIILALENSPDKDGNWIDGYEATIRRALNLYNGREYENSYGQDILNVRNNYYPNLNK